MKKDQSNKDLPLKFMCKTLFKEMGYNTHYEVKLRTKSYISSIKAHDVSDIDVFGCNFLPDMTLHTIGAECKSGETGALDELYKFVGVIDYFELHKGYFIKTKIHHNARQISKKRNISCFTESELRKLLLGFDIDVDRQLNIEKARFKKLTQAIISFKQNNEKLVDYLTYEYWNKDNWRNIHNIIHLLPKFSQKELFPLDNIPKKYFYYYCLELFCVSMLKNISEAMSQNYSDIDQALQNSLYGGGKTLDEKRRIHDLVSQATNEDNPFSPEWESDFINISSRFAGHTKNSALIIHLLQDIRENAFYSDKIDIKPIVIKPYADLTRKFLQDIIQFLIKHAAIDSCVFEEFMQL